MTLLMISGDTSEDTKNDQLVALKQRAGCTGEGTKLWATHPCSSFLTDKMEIRTPLARLRYFCQQL